MLFLLFWICGEIEVKGNVYKYYIFNLGTFIYLFIRIKNKEEREGGR